MAVVHSHLIHATIPHARSALVQTPRRAQKTRPTTAAACHSNYETTAVPKHLASKANTHSVLLLLANVHNHLNNATTPFPSVLSILHIVLTAAIDAVLSKELTVLMP